jgi:hypothetical protein
MRLDSKAWHGKARPGAARLGKANILSRGGEMNEALRGNVQELANEGLSSIKDAVLGKAAMTERVKEVIRIVSLGIKVEHMNQIAAQSNRSFALRLIPHLPKAVDKDEYVKITNPQIAPLMLPRPKKK